MPSGLRMDVMCLRSVRCEPGYEFYYVDVATSSIVCRETRIGEFKEVLSNSPGLKCPAGSSTVDTGNISLQDCVCTPGYHFDISTNRCEVSRPAET